MLYDAVTLDASMTASQALRRLAIHGYWLVPTQPDAHAWLEEYAARIRTAAKLAPGENLGARVVCEFSAADAAEVLERPIRSVRVAIRRRVGASLFWHARRIDHVLNDLYDVPGHAPVADVLQLHEQSAVQARQADDLDHAKADDFSGVVLAGSTPVAVAEVALRLGRRGSRLGPAALKLSRTQT